MPEFPLGNESIQRRVGVKTVNKLLELCRRSGGRLVSSSRSFVKDLMSRRVLVRAYELMIIGRVGVIEWGSGSMINNFFPRSHLQFCRIKLGASKPTSGTTPPVIQLRPLHIACGWNMVRLA